MQFRNDYIIYWGCKFFAMMLLAFPVFGTAQVNDADRLRDYIESRRALFYAGEQERDSLILHLALLTDEMDSAYEAFDYYNYLLRQSGNDSATYALMMACYHTGLRAGRYQETGQLLNRVFIEEMKQEMQISMLNYHILASIMLGEQSNVLTSVESLSTLQSPQRKSELLAFRKRYIRCSKLNPRTAAALSLILPGLGQAYSGRYGQAINSLLLNGTLVTGLVFTGNAVNYTSSALFWTNPITHYYIGGAKAAYEFCEERIRYNRVKCYNDFLQVMVLH